MSKPPPPSKRPSTTSTSDHPKPPCTIHPTATIADKAFITGTHPVHIGEHAVLHPYCKILSTHGSVTIGAYSTVSEMAVIGGGTCDTEIGDRVEIGPGAVVEGKSAGEGSVIEGVGTIGSGAVVGKFCRITPMGEVGAGEELRDFMVVYGDGKRRFNKTLAENKEVREAKSKGQDLQVQLLKRLIPNASAKWGAG